MAKQAQTHKGARVLEDQTAGAVATPQVAQSEVKAKAKKNTLISIMYVDETGKEGKVVQDNVAGVHVKIEGEVDKVINFSDLPAVIQRKAMAFGLNTVLRNQANTTFNAEGSKADAVEALQTRLAGFYEGEWARTGEGGEGGTPLVIESMVRAYTDAGKAELAASKLQGWLDHYRALDKDGKAAQTKKWFSNAAVDQARTKITAERAAERAKKLAAEAAKTGSASTDGLDDL